MSDARLGVGEEMAGPPDGPVNRGDRLPMLDVLRGVALLGILLINIDDWYAPEWLKDIPFGTPHPGYVGWHSQLDVVIVAFKWLFIEGKMRGLFAALFGAGVVLFTERMERGPRRAQGADIYCRRNLWLLVFGLAHGIFIWGGDILSFYGLIALVVLYPFRHLSGRRLVAIGAAVWLVLGTLGTLNVWGVPETVHQAHLVATAAQSQASGKPLTAEQVSAVAAERRHPAELRDRTAKRLARERGGYIETLPAHAKSFLGNLAECATSGDDFEILGAMLLGMGLFKLGFFPGRLSRRTYLVTAIAGYAVSTPIVLFGLSRVYAAHFSDAAYMVWMQGPYCLCSLAAMLANASLIILVAKTRAGAAALAPISAVGRTAFSNYILTSVLCQTLFVWSSLSLYGRLEYYQTVLVAFGVWIINVAASNLWLKAFAFGPLEWVWRSLTYWKRQPLLLRQDRTSADAERNALTSPAAGSHAAAPASSAR